MKRILLFLTIIFTVISSGMMHLVFHICTTEPVVHQSIQSDCCSKKSATPKCCESENKTDIEPAFCCENVQWYYFTPKFNEGFKKQLNIPFAHSIQLVNNELSFKFINKLNHIEIKQNQFHNLFPPNLTWNEEICVWNI